ncbi:MAG: hypothetical protein AAGK32_10785 [Actinomycetota bacterium]
MTDHSPDGALRTERWAIETGGALTAVQRRACRRAALPTYARHAKDLVLLAARLGRASGSVVDWMPAAPDSALTRAALEECADQGPDMEAHGLRTWLFGSMLAGADRIDLDPEMLHVASIAHDVGLADAVDGEDFTVRSAAAAARCFGRAGRELEGEQEQGLRDAVVAHTTPGIDVDEDPLATYIQAGAMVDLVGLRLRDLPRDVVAEVYRRHPQRALRDALPRALEAEAEAVPEGRFALLASLGFGWTVKLAPNRRA